MRHSLSSLNGITGAAPSIVNPNTTVLPANAVESYLPSIVRGGAAGLLAGSGCGTTVEQVYGTDEPGVLCRIGEWVNSNPVLAWGVVALAFWSMQRERR